MTQAFLTMLPAFILSTHPKVSGIIQQLLCKYSCSKVLYLHDQRFEKVFDANVSYYNMQSCSELGDIEYNCYVISYVTLKQLDVELKTVYKKVGFSSQHFVVFVSYRDQKILDIFTVLWKYFLRKAVVLTEELKLYKAEHRQVRLVLNVAGLEFEDGVANRTLRIIASPIMPFVSKDLKHGLEVMILKELVDQLRLFPVFVERLNQTTLVNFGNGSYSWDMQKIYDHEADIVMQSIGYIFDTENKFDKTYVHAFSKAGFFVPVANEVAPWRRLAMIFHHTTWIATFASFLSTTFFYTKLGGGNAWMMYNILFAPAPRQPKLLKPRLVFIAWTYTVLVLISSYQSLLVLFLFKQVLNHQVSTVDELVASGLTFGGFITAKKFFLLYSNSTNLHIYDNYFSCPRLGTQCYNRVIYDRDFAFFRAERLMYYQLQLNKTHRAYMISPSQLLYIGFYLPKASPFTQSMSQMVILMWDVGLIEKWDVYRTGFVHKESDKSSQPITLEHLLLVWGVYGFGIVLSGVAFLYELAHSSQIF